MNNLGNSIQYLSYSDYIAMIFFIHGVINIFTLLYIPVRPGCDSRIIEKRTEIKQSDNLT